MSRRITRPGRHLPARQGLGFSLVDGLDLRRLPGTVEDRFFGGRPPPPRSQRLARHLRIRARSASGLVAGAAR
ncbi:hypothetical protein CHELA1G2_21333 [Hyphomicrobiales bacterium]|nr:hypothetical protein CHELA1G2_21333 [Hyphomicrobiales bacterium]